MGVAVIRAIMKHLWSGFEAMQQTMGEERNRLGEMKGDGLGYFFFVD
jgi:hypothetical protein